MSKKLIGALALVGLATTFVACAQPTTATSEVSSEQTQEAQEVTEKTEGEADAMTAASEVDATTSASIVPENLVASYVPKGFTNSESKKALFVVGDPRKDSVAYDLANTAMKYFESNGVEVELRDLYTMNFNPVLAPEQFYYAKDGKGEPTPEIKTEQDFVTQADYIIFAYPNWHDTPTAIVKGYMETVFAKKFAYQDTSEGLDGMLKEKSIYTIMNAGFLGGGRGYIGDGVGINDAAWDEYMKAFEVLDNDTADFWGLENKGRFVNDRTPKNSSEKYEVEINELRAALEAELNEVFFQ
ncbi:MAG: NAD(P)H-dependent oxidoreductase [Cellulosilyticaceae bacterium]